MNKVFIDNRFGTGEKVSVVFHRYVDSNNVAIEMVCAETCERWAMASVNVPGNPLSDDLVAIKNYEENEGIDRLLVAAGIIETKPLRHLINGYATIPVYRLTREAQAEARAVPKH